MNFLPQVMKHLLIPLSIALASPSGLTQAARASTADFQTEVWAVSCMACHGTDGRAEGVGMSLNGRTSAELADLLLAYKSGQRSGTIMHQHAKGYSDEQLKRIAQYFSKFK
jgi:sulfide dehydrogenase cytochrome subunit